jgi:hypothetical protein
LATLAQPHSQASLAPAQLAFPFLPPPEPTLLSRLVGQLLDWQAGRSHAAVDAHCLFPLFWLCDDRVPLLLSLICGADTAVPFHSFPFLLRHDQVDLWTPNKSATERFHDLPSVSRDLLPKSITELL